MRKKGFYWVIFLNAGVWEVAEWTGKYWLVTGVDERYKDDAFGQIDEQQIIKP